MKMKNYELENYEKRLNFFYQLNAEAIQKIGKYAEENGENWQEVYKGYYLTFAPQPTAGFGGSGVSMILLLWMLLSNPNRENVIPPMPKPFKPPMSSDNQGAENILMKSFKDLMNIEKMKKEEEERNAESD